MEENEERADAGGLWPAKPHTLAKHRILTRYLAGWFPILTAMAARLGTTRRKITYVDAFAGPGEYTGGEDGSPIRALKCVIDRGLRVPVHFLFVEKDPQLFAHLRQRLDSMKTEYSASPSVGEVHAVYGDCVRVLGELLDRAEADRVPFGPAMCFLDQFGYSAVPIDLVRRIMSNPQCEIIAYLDFRSFNRYLGDA